MELMTETCTIEIDKKLLEELSDILKCGIHYEIKTVEIKDFDYSRYPQWMEQKKISSKSYRKLKEIEYRIVNNKSNQ